MSKKAARTAALIMLLAAIAFIFFALNNPQAGFPWSNAVSYTIYGIYAAAMLILFLVSFKRK